jgi:D-arabinose 1-dehydrogenase-like Zn-dependent alcohol dehydrogenase
MRCQGPFDQAVRQLTDGQGADVVIEFVSNAQTLPCSYRSLKRAGRLVSVGYVPEVAMSIMPHELVRNEWEIVGTRATTKQELQETIDLVGQGRIQPIIDRVLPLEDVELAFEVLRQGSSLGRNVVAI